VFIYCSRMHNRVRSNYFNQWSGIIARKGRQIPMRTESVYVTRNTQDLKLCIIDTTLKSSLLYGTVPLPWYRVLCLFRGLVKCSTCLVELLWSFAYLPVLEEKSLDKPHSFGPLFMRQGMSERIAWEALETSGIGSRLHQLRCRRLYTLILYYFSTA
jgi:hypothetical protein